MCCNPSLVRDKPLEAPVFVKLIYYMYLPDDGESPLYFHNILWFVYKHV